MLAAALLAMVGASVFVVSVAAAGLVGGVRRARRRRFDRHVTEALDLVAAEAWCASCERLVPAECVSAHVRLHHRPRPVGVEDSADWGQR